ncbi:MAG: hypothetical protein FJ098_10580 [Deltaproteobacteria bacterium]|nr:hypothetical protein [Deltaproteobacteria bacterium]
MAFRKLDAVSLTLDPGSFTLGPRETVEVAGGPRVLTRAEFTVADAVSVQHMERDFTAHRLEVVWTFTDPGSRPVPMVSCLASEALARDPGATRAEVLSTLPPGIPPPRVAVAVMAGEGDATDPGLRARLAAFLGASLAREAGLEAVPGEAVTRRLEEAVAAGAAACTGTACLDELARSLDAGWLLRPVLHRTGFRCTLAASLKATRDGADEREARLATDCSEGALMVAAAALALNLREVHPGLAVSPR